MGTAGLDVRRLAALLQRIKVDCTLIEGDESQDHCVLHLSSIKRPGHKVIIEYENQGSEPRLVEIRIEPPIKDVTSGQSSDTTFKTLNLRGARSDDPKKILQTIKEIF
jgi:hypothetical protein